MDTILINKYVVSKEEFQMKIEKKVVPYVREFSSDISNLVDEIREKCEENELIHFLGKKISFNTKLKIFLPDLSEYHPKTFENVGNIQLGDWFDEQYFCKNVQYYLPKLSQLQSIRAELMNAYSIGKCYACICDRTGASWGLIVAYDPFMNQFIPEKDIPVVVIPVAELEYVNTNELLVKYLVPCAVCPDGLSVEMVNCLSDLVILYQHYPEYLSITYEGKIQLRGIQSMLNDFYTDSNKEWMNSLHMELTKVLKQYYLDRNVKEDEDNEMAIKEELLNCEKIRADIEPYEERLLMDPNRGHWDLWKNQEDGKYTIELADKLVARNPLCDINENGVIAIDFGTKSTIVVYQSDIEHSLPMGIGDGNLSKAPTTKRYENPTVMHFVNLDHFLSAYSAKDGRPKTKWEDLTISHTAMDQFLNSKSEEYYEYLHQIKQWAGQREKQFRIQSHDGKTYTLPAFLDLKEEDWNPIELYAYYIGLYINNMRKGHGIFLDYYLSFPVTYEKKIREKIVHSFEKGLKKSLPSFVLQNEEAMKKFHVNGEISEPAAYAVCALQEYELEPDDDEEIFYGIFDFGGGTTDFDFGLWKQSSKRRYDYTIENFGAGGDEFLGGENLLEMLAFEVFKDNQTLMRERGYTFTLAPKCTEFLGSDSLLADSQEAEKNMHNLMEKLRPYWERQNENKVDTLEKQDSDVDKMIAKIKKAIITHPHASSIERELEYIDAEEEVCDVMTEEETYKMSLLYSLIEQYDIKLEKDDVQMKIVLTLFDRNGQDHPGETLYFDQNKFNQIIEERIREGVNNFFSALLLSYQNDKVRKPTTVNILLAGNSCKSPVVKKVFEEVIAEHERQVKEQYGIEGDVGKLFDVFPPLGTEQAYEKMESRGITPVRDDFEKPTGKTGVAFGLIQCRDGGTIERIINSGIEDEIPFQFFIGWRSKKKFVFFKDDTKPTKYLGKPDYNKWYRFIEADASMFDLYYTTLPECINGKLQVDGNASVKRLRCNIDVVDENAFVYIRAIDPHTLEYVVAKSDEVDSSKLGNIVRKEL